MTIKNLWLRDGETTEQWRESMGITSTKLTFYQCRIKQLRRLIAISETQIDVLTRDEKKR